MKEEDKSLSSSEELRALIKEANLDDPDPTVVKALRRMLNRHPAMWRIAGDLARTAALHLIQDGITATPAVKESLSAAWDGLKMDLGYDNAPMLEQLLIEQVALCWLRLYTAEQGYTNKVYTASSYESLNYWERRLNASQRRYLRACETLARVRKIIRRTPALQINIAAQGGQQVNVAGDVKP